jgi:hypothetical protein
MQKIIQENLKLKKYGLLWLKMDHIFKSPHHIHFLTNFNFVVVVTCMLKSYLVGLSFT